MSRVASFWALIRESAVDLYRLTSAYDPGALDKEELAAEFLLLHIDISEADHGVRSSKFLEAFKQVYDVVSACGAPVHGLVYTDRDGQGMFGSKLSHEDLQSLLKYANGSLGRRIDF